MLLKDCRYVVTQDAKRTILEKVDILLEGDRIAKVGKGLQGSPVIDCSDRIVLPGLVNAHTHLGMGLLRGASDDKELHEWLAEVVAKERELSDEEFYEGALTGCRERIRKVSMSSLESIMPEPPMSE